MKILVVEDDSAIRELIASVLADEGHSVWDYGTPEDALAKLEAEPVFDLIIADYFFAGIDGVTLATRLLSRRRGSRVLVISGNPEIAQLRTQGVPGFNILKKPFNIEQLLAAVETTASLNLLGGPEPR